MLKPKKKIVIVYGHDSKLLKLSEETIRSIASEGYRVKSEILNEESLLRENDSIFEALKQKFSKIDAAFIFMTSDDVALSLKEANEVLEKNQNLNASEFRNRLKMRSRQNVVYELGYVTAKVGENHYRIFCPSEIEIPSDIQGKFTVRDLSPKNVRKIIRDFVKHNLNCKKKVSSLKDNAYKITYSNLCNVTDKSLDEFDKEYQELDSPDDQIVYLFERIVFDSYFQKPSWWLSKINSIEAKTELQRISIKLLNSVFDYMSAWRPSPQKSENVQDINRIFTAKENFEKGLKKLEGVSVNPIIKIVALDYLGLAYNKLGRNEDFNKGERKIFFEKSVESLFKTAELSNLHDDPNLPLWEGFSLFNLAQSIQEKSQLLGDHKNNQWREIFHKAIDVRDQWRRCHYQLPIEILEGIETEYHHSVSDRILRIETDSDGNIKEKPPYALTKDDIRDAAMKYADYNGFGGGCFFETFV